MSEIVKLTCPNCSGKLQIGANIQQFACSFCGQEYTVNRGGGIVSVEPLVEGLNRIHRGVDQTASELAIQRLEREIGGLEREIGSIDEQHNKLSEDEKLCLQNMEHEREIQRDNNRQTIKTASFIQLVLGGMFLIFLFAIIGANNFSGGVIGSSLLFMLILLTIFFALRSSVQKAKDKLAVLDQEGEYGDSSQDLLEIRELKEQLSDLVMQKRSEIVEKRQQLQRHQKIVSGPS